MLHSWRQEKLGQAERLKLGNVLEVSYTEGGETGCFMPTLTNRMERVEATLERVSQSQDRTQANLDRLSQVVNTLAESVAYHDNHIESLIAVGERHEAELRTLVREWQAYLRTMHPRQ